MDSRSEAYALFGDFLSKVAQFAAKECNVAVARQSLSAINNFFYQKPEGSKTFLQDRETYEYFSKYHVFWRECHEEILCPQVQEDSCRELAGVLHELRSKYGRSLFYTTVNTAGLKPRDLAQVRFFTAPQDFRGSIDIENAFKAYRDDPDRFRPEVVLQDVDGFLETVMGRDKANQQRDKREKYAACCAELLSKADCEAYDLAGKFANSASKIREFLLSAQNAGTGYGAKKCDMFLRDMVVWNVWTLKDVECIDVASDSNTMRVALRTGILTTAVSLLSSFLDVFCYQYGLIDRWNAKSWRCVWEMWRRDHTDTCPECPGLLDYFVYRIVGKEFCRDQGLTVLRCDRDPSHIVYWHGRQKKVCPLCSSPRGRLSAVSQCLPCTHEKGHVAIESSRYVSGDNPILPGLKVCPFVSLCKPTTVKFRPRIAPDSISIWGPTSWSTAYTTAEQGGGGLSS